MPKIVRFVVFSGRHGQLKGPSSTTLNGGSAFLGVCVLFAILKISKIGQTNELALV